MDPDVVTEHLRSAVFELDRFGESNCILARIKCHKSNLTSSDRSQTETVQRQDHPRIRLSFLSLAPPPGYL